VVTNIHVISNNPNLKITTNTGAPITILSCKGAIDRDLAMIAIKDGSFSYLTLATDVGGTVQPGDEVITPGNSEGGEVMLNTDGKVLGIGPDRVEFDNPIYHGNSGGPVIHVKSGKVIGIVTEGVKVDVSDELDKASFANRNSAIAHSMRYFGFRLDNVPGWEPYDWNRFQNETAFLDQFDQRNRCLDSFLNAPNDDKPEDILWEEDAKIVKADDSYFDQASGDADASQKMDADRVVWAEISDIAGIDMDAIQNPNNFYSFDRQRAKDEIAYRKALKKELNEISDSVSRLGSLARKSN
jgi:Trypsin-like peptidase domain